MTERFGDRNTFAIEIGPAAGSAALRAVDLWATGKQLTPEVAFQLLERDETEFREHYWFLPPGNAGDTVEPLAAAGATWWLEGFRPAPGEYDAALRRIEAGPPR